LQAVLESQDGKEKEIVRAIEALSKQIEENTKNAASLQSLKKAWKKIQKQRQQKETAKKKIEREVETIKRRIEQEKEAAEQDYQVPKLPVPPPPCLSTTLSIFRSR